MLVAFLVSTGVVALAEMGDKTQLLALMLAARYRSHLPVVFGIAVATLANHALAAAFGAFGTTLVAFFIVEIGDKTQIATVALAARYPELVQTVAVVCGTTLGMLIANVPAVYLGNKLLRRVPLRMLQRIAAAMFAVLGVLVMLA